MYDAAVIGAGIVGSSIVRELSKYQLKLILIDRASDISNGATKANSGIIHSGYDAACGTLKAKLNVLGCSMYEEMCRDLDVPYKKTGSLVLGFNDDDMFKIEELYKRGLKNGVKGLQIIDRDKLFSLEPKINNKAVGALLAKEAGIVSPYELAIALCENAFVNGVEFKLSTIVEKIIRKKDYFIIGTNNGDIKAKYIINAAGVHSDEINNMLGGEYFKIIPRRGEYCLLDKNIGNVINHVLFQVPDEKGKGILVTPTAHGNILIGPNAAAIDDKDDVSTTREGIDEVINKAKKSLEYISKRDIITSFSGVRATPEKRDFIINVPAAGAVNAAGIESPGLTSAPAIALMVLELLENQGLKLIRKNSFIENRENTKLFINMNEEERERAIKRDKNYGRIICRCEQITEGDIINSIRRPLGAKTVDGVKRRVRAGMGRCQGGFCMSRVVEILSRELSVDPKEVRKNNELSYILIGRTK